MFIPFPNYSHNFPLYGSGAMLLRQGVLNYTNVYPSSIFCILSTVKI